MSSAGEDRSPARKPVPAYLRPPASSCHDACKYGGEPVKPATAVARRPSRAVKNDEDGAAGDEGKRRLAFKMRSLSRRRAASRSGSLAVVDIDLATTGGGNDADDDVDGETETATKPPAPARVAVSGDKKARNGFKIIRSLSKRSTPVAVAEEEEDGQSATTVESEWEEDSPIIRARIAPAEIAPPSSQEVLVAGDGGRGVAKERKESPKAKVVSSIRSALGGKKEKPIGPPPPVAASPSAKPTGPAAKVQKPIGLAPAAASPSEKPTRPATKVQQPIGPPPPASVSKKTTPSKPAAPATASKKVQPLIRVRSSKGDVFEISAAPAKKLSVRATAAAGEVLGTSLQKSQKRRGGGSRGVGDSEAAAAVMLRHQQTLERKKSARLYNSVIEETVAKSRRKSRVKALVGAFEAVIGILDTKAKAASKPPRG